jgi:hypothetical protein
MGDYHEPDQPRSYPVDVALAEHLVDQLLDTGFDIATSPTASAATVCRSNGRVLG